MYTPLSIVTPFEFSKDCTNLSAYTRDRYKASISHTITVPHTIPCKIKTPLTYSIRGAYHSQLWAQLGLNQRPPDYEFPFFDMLFDRKKSGYLSYLQL